MGLAPRTGEGNKVLLNMFGPKDQKVFSINMEQNYMQMGGYEIDRELIAHRLSGSF